MKVACFGTFGGRTGYSSCTRGFTKFLRTMGIDVDKVHHIQKISQETVSIDTAVGDEGDDAPCGRNDPVERGGAYSGKSTLSNSGNSAEVADYHWCAICVGVILVFGVKIRLGTVAFRNNWKG